MKKSVITKKSYINDEENDYLDLTPKQKLLSLPVNSCSKPIKIKNKKIHKLIKLNEKMDKNLAYVSHLNYKLILANDKLDRIKNFKHNLRVCKSDDENDD